ncbi:MAG TPA: hypothetical protein VGL93_22115 [Streptosporangiaceae bacterium]
MIHIPRANTQRRCSVCGKSETRGWPLFVATTRAGNRLVCAVGPCHRLAILRAGHPEPPPVRRSALP